MEDSDYEERISNMDIWSKKLTAKIAKTIGEYHEIIYHYTDSSGLIGILSTGKIWATHVTRLNDVTEYQHGLAMVEALVRNHPTKLQALIDRALEDLSTKDTYISCYSGNRDLLSQWRAYAGTGTGYAIGFQTRNMATLDDRMPLLEKVIYEEDIAKAVVSQLLDEASSFPFHNEFGEVEVGYLLGAIAGLLNVTASVIKHPSFAEENEFRQI